MSITMGGAEVITVPEADLRINAMASEFREIIVSLSQRCANLSVANALANKVCADKDEEIKRLNKELDSFKQKNTTDATDLPTPPRVALA